MSDEVPKAYETVRPPEGDEDVYSASTKVGQAAPEILELVRQAEEDAALKPARVPTDASLGASDTKATAPPPPDHPSASAAEHAERTESGAPPSAARGDDVATDAAMVAAQVPPSTGANVVAASDPVRSAQGVPPLSMVVLAAAVAIAGWLGYQAMHAPPAPSTTTPPGAFVR